MKPIRNLRRLALSIIAVSSTLMFSACSSPTTSPSTGTIIQTPTENPIHTKGKDNHIQSVSFAVNNHNGHDFAARIYSGVTYDDIIVPPGTGTTYYTITNHVTSAVINGQTVYFTPSQVTLPDNTVITTNVVVIDMLEVY